MESWIAQRRALEGSRHWVNRAGRRSRWRKLPFKILMALFKRSIRLTPFYGWGRRNALDIKLIQFDLTFPDLPAPLDGYRILHVSDPHLDRLPELVDAARALLVGLKVDMLALTGDIRGDDRAPVERSAGLLKEALAGVSVRGPRLAVLGNHDPVEMVGALERVGFDVLINRSLIVRHEGDSLRVTGLDDVNCFYTESARTALDTHAGEFRIALVHSAEVADDADETGYSLYLCGHTHGGQICLPGGRPIITHLKRFKHAASGLWRQGHMIGYTSCGLGVSDLPVRFNTRGEVAVITLRRNTSSLRSGPSQFGLVGGRMKKLKIRASRDAKALGP
jgi:predicted MPP superfamily phosphohydrolase